MARPLRQLNSVLTAQHNVVGRWQMTSAQIRAARLQVHHEQWQEPTNQVFVMGNGPLSDEQRMWVAVLHGGPDARLAGRTALTIHGRKEPLASPLPCRRQPQSHAFEDTRLGQTPPHNEAGRDIAPTSPSRRAYSHHPSGELGALRPRSDVHPPVVPSAAPGVGSSDPLEIAAPLRTPRAHR